MALTAAKHCDILPLVRAARRFLAATVMALVATLPGSLAQAAERSALPAVQSKSADATSALDRIEPPGISRGWTSIVLHHSATSSGNIESIDAAHRRNRDRAGNPWLGIGYHFVVGNGNKMADGEVQSTFRWQKQLPGAHAGIREHNDLGIGICLIGNFDQAAPTQRQMAALSQLVKDLATRYDIPRERLLRHQDVQATLCPGRMFPFDQVRSLVSLSNGT